MQFSTHDRDNDLSAGSCAVDLHGAFWYSDCGQANPFGTFYVEVVTNEDGMTWYSFLDDWTNMNKVEFYIRPVDN